jgi:hypothetical protein
MLRGAVVVALFAVACGGPKNSLEGSISESFSLDFDRVVFQKQGDTLLIEYLKDVSSTTNKVCKITIDEVGGLGLGDDTEIKGEVFNNHVTIQRVATDEARFPPVTGGKVHFETLEFSNGGDIDGDFECAFDNGRTLSGNFAGSIKDVPLD